MKFCPECGAPLKEQMRFCTSCGADLSAHLASEARRKAKAAADAEPKSAPGPFDAEPETVSLMDRYIADHGCRNDFSDTRMHHEIYLSDARKVPPEKWKTVIRHPIRKA